MTATLRTRRRALDVVVAVGVAAAATATTATSAACVADFATINLIVHESATEEFQLASGENALQVSYVIEEQREGAPPPVTETFNYTKSSGAASGGHELGAYAQRMTMSLVMGPTLGAPLESLLAIGRVDPFIIPSLDDGPFETDARAFIAAPDVVETLNVDFPAGDLQAVCDNRAGFVHAVGNQAAYSFDDDDLELTDNSKPFATDVPSNAIACDVTDEFNPVNGQPIDGKVVIAYGNCGTGETTHKVLLDIGEAPLPGDGELCDPFVQYVELDPTTDDDDIVWIAGASFASLILVSEARNVGTVGLSGLTRPVRHVLLSEDGTLIVQGAGEDETFAVRRAASNDALQTPQRVSGLARLLAGDPSGTAGLFLDGEGGFALRVATVATVDGNGVAGQSFSRPVSLDFDVANEASLPTRILVINGDDADHGNDFVVAMNDAGEMQVEGGRLHRAAAETSHNAFALGFGRAVILAGDAPGHAVLVRPFDANERATLDD